MKKLCPKLQKKTTKKLPTLWPQFPPSVSGNPKLTSGSWYWRSNKMESAADFNAWVVCGVRRVAIGWSKVYCFEGVKSRQLIGRSKWIQCPIGSFRSIPRDRAKRVATRNFKIQWKIERLFRLQGFPSNSHNYYFS